MFFILEIKKSLDIKNRQEPTNCWKILQNLHIYTHFLWFVVSVFKLSI